MGIYIYSIRARKIRICINGDMMDDVHMFQYLTKPWYEDWGQEDRATRLLKARCDNYWANRGGTPKYVVLPSGEHPKKPKVLEGDPVFRWNERWQGWDYDTPGFEKATHLGWVFKNGTRWELHRKKYSYSSGYLKGGCLYVKDSGTFLTREQADAWIAGQNKMDRYVRGAHVFYKDGILSSSPEKYPAPLPSLVGVPREHLTKLAEMGDPIAEAAIHRLDSRGGL